MKLLLAILGSIGINAIAIGINTVSRHFIPFELAVVLVCSVILTTIEKLRERKNQKLIDREQTIMSQHSKNCKYLYR